MELNGHDGFWNKQQLIERLSLRIKNCWPCEITKETLDNWPV